MTGLDSCISKCYCENKSGNIDFECAYYDCFDKGPPSDNCYTMNSLNDCCNDNYICGNTQAIAFNYKINLSLSIQQIVKIVQHVII